MIISGWTPVANVDTDADDDKRLQDERRARQARDLRNKQLQAQLQTPRTVRSPGQESAMRDIALTALMGDFAEQAPPDEFADTLPVPAVAASPQVAGDAPPQPVGRDDAPREPRPSVPTTRSCDAPLRPDSSSAVALAFEQGWQDEPAQPPVPAGRLANDERGDKGRGRTQPTHPTLPVEAAARDDQAAPAPVASALQEDMPASFAGAGAGLGVTVEGSSARGDACSQPAPSRPSAGSLAFEEGWNDPASQAAFPFVPVPERQERGLPTGSASASAQTATALDSPTWHDGMPSPGCDAGAPAAPPPPAQVANVLARLRQLTNSLLIGDDGHPRVPGMLREDAAATADRIQGGLDFLEGYCLDATPASSTEARFAPSGLETQISQLRAQLQGLMSSSGRAGAASPAPAGDAAASAVGKLQPARASRDRRPADYVSAISAAGITPAAASTLPLIVARSV